MTTMSLAHQKVQSRGVPKSTSLEQELIKKAQKDIRFFEEIYNNHYENIFRYVYQRVDSKEDAFDITSQIFLKAMNNLKKYEFRGVPFSAWLFRIAKSEVYQFHRDNQKQPPLNINDEQLNNLKEEVEELSGKLTNDDLINLLASLKDDDLQFIEMRFLEQRSFKEIGDILNITEGNAKVKTHRILKKLQNSVK